VGRGIFGVPMRMMFALCWLVIVTGIAFYTVIGVIHH
jgi:hypothetical protein